MPSFNDPTPAPPQTVALDGRQPGLPDAPVPRWGDPHRPQGSAAAVAEQHWNQLAREGKWMIVVYQTCQSTRSEVVRLKRASLNNQFKVRIEGELVRVVHERDTDLLAVEDRRVLDMPEDRIRWYEIIDEFHPEDVQPFQAALSRGASHAHPDPPNRPR